MKRPVTRRHFLELVTAVSSLKLQRAAAASCSHSGPLPLNPWRSIPQGHPATVQRATKVAKRPLLSTPEGKAALSQLFRAYDQLIKRNPTNHTSLYSQMWWHDLYCKTHTGSVDVHGTWAFLPWHRAFLYFHEKILQSALNEPTFRIPVWDWENVNAVPDTYNAWTETRLCSKHLNNDLDQLVNSCSIQAWLYSGTDVHSFVGYPPSDYHTPPSQGPMLASQGVHSFVHTRIGGLLGPPRTSAIDPLFYAHHANIDRFWVHWTRSHPGIPSQEDGNRFDKQEFNFYDARGNLQLVTSGDFLDEQHLGYCYDPPAIPVPTATPIIQQTIHNADEAFQFFQLFELKLVNYLSNDLRLKDLHLNDLSDLRQAGAGELSRLVERAKSLLVNVPSGFMLPIRLEFNAPNVTPGQYYLVVLSPGKCTDTKNRPIAGFGVFGSPGHSVNRVVATGCLTSADIDFILNNPRLSILYGVPDASATTLSNLCSPIWSDQNIAEITILRFAVAP